MIRVFTNFLAIFFAFILLFGCATPIPQLKTDVNYQRDAEMDVWYVKNGKWAGPLKIYGMGVMYQSTQYKVKVTPPGKADMITITSCHRELKTPNPRERGGWFKKGYYEFVIPMIGTVDYRQECSFDIGIYEKKKGRHAWGTIAIENPDKYKMPAITKCNGRYKKYDGVSVCQAKKGLLQEYVFDRLVSVAAPTGCEIANMTTEAKYSKTWRFVMPPGECEIHFIDVKKPWDQVHKAFFFGYDTIPIRGVK